MVSCWQERARQAVKVSQCMGPCDLGEHRRDRIAITFTVYSNRLAAIAGTARDRELDTRRVCRRCEAGSEDRSEWLEKLDRNAQARAGVRTVTAVTWMHTARRRQRVRCIAIDCFALRSSRDPPSRISPTPRRIWNSIC